MFPNFSMKKTTFKRKYEFIKNEPINIKFIE